MTAKITVSIRLNIPPDTAFELFTRDVDIWWRRGMKYRHELGEGGRMAFEPGEGGRFVERYDGGREFEIGRILVWQPGERLSFVWRLSNFAEGQATEVDIRFTPVAEGTRLTLEHRGWDTIPPEHPAHHGLDLTRSQLSRARWWDEQLEALRGMIAK
jgi:uncharacterized protein YndB with AHSA1/START domain